MTILNIKNLTKRYGGHTAVDDVSFSVSKGEIFGILGPNGAGKTTTVECISGLRSPDSGSVTVCGLDPQRNPSDLSGLTNRETAKELFISEATVKTHLLHAYTKLGVKDRAAAVAAAYSQGYLR